MQQLETALRKVGGNPNANEASDAELVTSALGQLATQNTSAFSDSRVFVGRGTIVDMMRVRIFLISFLY